MKLSIRYLDCCLSDYFQGFAGTVYAVPVNGKSRSGEVLQGLQDEISATELWLDGESGKDEHYQQLHDSANELFSDCDKRKTFSKHAGEECYAYFGVMIEKD